MNQEKRTNVEETVAAYAAACSEPDENKRRALLEKTWAENGVYTDPTAHVEGREALVQHISGFLKSAPGARIVLTSRVDVHHHVLRFSWRLLNCDGTTADGMDFGLLGADGRLVKIAGFFGPFPPLAGPGIGGSVDNS